MSRSRRKNDICGITTARSEKSFKVDSHKSFRAKVRMLLKRMLDCIFPQKMLEVKNPYAGPKDGKQYFGNKEMEESEYQKLKRK